MARSFDGVNDELTNSSIRLLSGADSFTVSLWYKAGEVVKSPQTRIMRAGTGWSVRHGTTLYFSEGSFTTGSGLTAPDITDWHHYLWRYDGAEWSKWLDGSKSVINASLTSSVGNPGDGFYVGSDNGTEYDDGSFAPIGVWGVALPDAFVNELYAGVAPDQFPGGLQAAYLITGNSSPELDYNGAGETLTVTGTTTVAGPEIVPRLDAEEVEPAWVADIYKSGGTHKVATFDLYTAEDIDVLGGSYGDGLLNDPTVSDNMPEGGGIIEPADTTLVLSTQSVDSFDNTTNFRDVGIRLRKYDRISHALKTAFVGTVTGRPTIGVDTLTLPCGGDMPELDELIPRITIEAETATRTKLLKDGEATLRPLELEGPVPVPCGNGGLVSPPYVELDTSNSPGGARFLIGWGAAAATSDATGIRIKGGFGDIDSAQAGLEKLAQWEDVNSSPFSHAPTYASTTTFTVTGNALDTFYKKGMPLRFVDGSGNVTDVTRVDAFSSGTVTVKDAVVPNPIVTVEVATEFIVEEDVWKYVGASNTTFLATVLHPLEPNFATVFEVATSQRANPATCIDQILSDEDWGLNQNTHNADFLTAALDLNSATSGAPDLSSAVRGVLGGDRSQRTARSIINELCRWRGIRIWKAPVEATPTTQEYRISVDKAPTKPAVPLEFGTGTRANIVSLPEWYYTPLSEAISTIRHRYGKGGRVRGDKPLIQADYEFANTMTVHGAGRQLELVSDFLRDHSEGAQVTYYIGQRLKRADQKGDIAVNHDAWRLKIGDPVACKSDGQGVDDTYRVLRKRESLTGYQLTVEGYNSDIFSVDTGVINAAVAQPTGVGNPDTRADSPTDGANLILNSDFSTGLKAEPTLAAGADTDPLPGWSIFGDQMTAVSVVEDIDTVGGQYLQVTTGGTVTDPPNITVPYKKSGTPLTWGIPVRENWIYIFSCYLDSDAAGGAASGVEATFTWFDVGGTTETGVLRITPGDVNPSGWARPFWAARAPANTKYMTFSLDFVEASTVYKIDAVKLEALSRSVIRPTPYSRHPAYGLHPSQVQAGGIKATPVGQTSAGTELAFDDSGEVTISSGSSQELGTDMLLAGDLHNVRAYVTETITSGDGATGFAIHADSASGTKLLSGVGLSQGSSGGTREFQPPKLITSATKLFIVAEGGTFNGTTGKVRVIAHRLGYADPTR